MPVPPIDRESIIERYTRRFGAHGHSPMTLGWNKGNQEIRFDVLTSQYNFRGKRILDIGCGFGDLIGMLSAKYGDDYIYHGVDLVPALIQEARRLHSGSDATFSCADILDETFAGEYDYAIASGIFNHKMKAITNYTVIEAVMSKAFRLSRDGIALDFLSDKVDYRHAHTFHSSPGKILNLAYRFSRNVVLRNDYMPFEFSVFINKDDSFSQQSSVFNLYKQRQPNVRQASETEPVRG
jgi:SAM-dependent methyltransferase